MPLQQHFDDLVSALNSGDVLGAFERHYAPDVVMQENRKQPVAGFDANLKREKEFMAAVKEWKSLAVTASAVNETSSDSGSTFLEYNFEFINTEDQTVQYEQVTVQTWKDGKIVRERFYYDTGS